MIITIILLSIFLFIAIFIIWNLSDKNDILESKIQEYVNAAEKVEQEAITHYQFYLGLFTKALSEMKRIDNRGSFSGDDEVGFAFRVILRSIEEVHAKLQAMKEEETV